MPLGWLLVDNFNHNMAGIPQTLPVPPLVNEMTMLNAIRIAASGTVTSFSFTDGAGITGVVTNPTTTPALALTLGVITPTSVNGLTLAAAAVGFTIAGGTTSKTLTVLDTGTAALLGIANAFTAAQSITVGTNSPTPATALQLINSTPATVGVQSASGALIFEAFGWKTTATAASQSVKFQVFNLPVQGTTNPSGTLIFQSSINGGAYATAVAITDTGRICLGGTTSSFPAIKSSATTLRFVLADDSGFTSFRSRGCQIDYDGVKSVGLANSSGAAWTAFLNRGDNGTISIASTGAFAFTSGDGDAAMTSGLVQASSALVKVTNGSSGRGTLDALGYQVGGVAGASFGPGAPASITVVNGIITAIS